MIDIHCHLLPAVDDGAKSWEITLEMCRMAEADGVTHIVATPHANYEYAYDRASHLALLDELRLRVPGMSFSLGCDFHLSYENIEDAMQHPERYAIGDTRYLLVELSEYSAFNVAQTLYELQTVGLVPILTHPERNPLILGKPDLLHEYADVGCLFQITANSLTGFWGKPSQKMCEEMLRNKMVHFIASDAHGIKSRPPILSAARDAAARIIGAEAAEKLVDANPAAVVANQVTEQIAAAVNFSGQCHDRHLRVPAVSDASSSAPNRLYRRQNSTFRRHLSRFPDREHIPHKIIHPYRSIFSIGNINNLTSRSVQSSFCNPHNFLKSTGTLLSTFLSSDTALSQCCRILKHPILSLPHPVYLLGS